MSIEYMRSPLLGDITRVFVQFLEYNFDEGSTILDVSSGPKINMYYSIPGFHIPNTTRYSISIIPLCHRKKAN